MSKVKNRNLTAAKRAKNDEFYTQLTDIEKELAHYKEHFKGKVVYCNCDDPAVSGFVRYFAYQFERLGLRRLIATGYQSRTWNAFSDHASEQAYCLVYEGDKNGNKIPDPEEFEGYWLEGDGDFRNDECVELLDQADIVVTNPPFSLFREYLAQLVEHGKKFLIIGNMNAITYKEVFPLIKDGKVWLGRTHPKVFVQPDGTTKSFGNVCWFTNLEHKGRNEELVLTAKYDPERHPKYDNYDAIEVSKVADIPADYDGVMGVPITFLDKHNPKQLEIVGLTTGRDEFEATPTKRYRNPLQVNPDGTRTNGSKANTRATLLCGGPPPGGIYYTADNADGRLSIVYARILIRRRP